MSQNHLLASYNQYIATVLKDVHQFMQSNLFSQNFCFKKWQGEKKLKGQIQSKPYKREVSFQ